MADFPRRYSIHFADLNPTIGAEIHKVRPVVVVSQNEMNRFLGTVVVCPLTTSLHPGWRSRIQIQCAGKPAENRSRPDSHAQQAATQEQNRPARASHRGTPASADYGDVRGIATGGGPDRVQGYRNLAPARRTGRGRSAMATASSRSSGTATSRGRRRCVAGHRACSRAACLRGAARRLTRARSARRC